MHQRVATALLILLAAAGAQATDQAMETRLVAYRLVESPDGGLRRESADVVQAGDHLEYELALRNTSSRPLGESFVSLPLPKGVSLLTDGAQPIPSDASLDGQLFQSYPAVRPVGGPPARYEPVPLAEYRALGWQVAGLDPGDERRIRVRVRVNP